MAIADFAARRALLGYKCQSENDSRAGIGRISICNKVSQTCLIYLKHLSSSVSSTQKSMSDKIVTANEKQITCKNLNRKKVEAKSRKNSNVNPKRITGVAGSGRQFSYCQYIHRK